MRLVLWDIDHTLIDTRGIGRELSAAAFEQATGLPMREQAQVDGLTEPVIFRETAALHGMTTDRADFERFAEHLVAGHLRHVSELRERGHALVGAAAALDALAQETAVLQAALTGNIRGVAMVKLETFGLDRHIDWGSGAYGEDDDVRSRLVHVALERASQRTGSRVTREDAVLIGDTPADVEAGQKSGVRVIAVASGRSSVATLHAAGADSVLTDLRDTETLVALARR